MLDMPRPVTFEYLSCAVNRTSHIAEWIQLHDVHDALVFGVHKSVAMWFDPSGHETPASSTSASNTTRSAPIPKLHLWPTQFQQLVHVLKVWHLHHDVPHLLMGSYDGALEMWRWSADDWQWTSEAFIPRAHNASVTAIGVPRDVHSCEYAPREFVTGGSDALLHVWSCSSQSVSTSATEPVQPQIVQTIDLCGAYPLDIALVRLPHTQTTLMAVALTDRRISLYVRSDGGSFTLQLRLDGHEDWVRALDFTVAWPHVWLASAAQDQHVRLWKLYAEEQAAQAMQESQAPPPDFFEAMARELMPNDQGIKTKTEWLTLPGERWGISLDALLLGHDAWVTDVRWVPNKQGQEATQRAALLTSSVDNSVIVWTPDASSDWPKLTDASAAEQSMWLPAHRLGDVGSMSGGFLGAHWRPHATDISVISHDRQGAVHLWKRTAMHKWEPQATISGHAGAARDAAWEPNGDAFLTVGVDRTTRLHGTYLHDETRSWHELARPQTHGYDMQAVSWLDRTSFVSAADEKILRVFAAPASFLDSANACRMWQTSHHRRVTHVLALSVHSPDQWYAGPKLRRAIEAVMTQARSKCLSVVIWAGTDAISMSGAEHLLQCVYAQAWAWAVRRNDLLWDISVYVIPASSDSEHGAHLWTQWSVAHAPIASLSTLDDPAFDVHAPTLTHDVTCPLTRLPLDVDASTAIDPAQQQQQPQQQQQQHVSVCGDTAVLGGTFDHLHIGHKLLLSMAILSARKELLVGVTSTALLVNKKHREYIEPRHVRMAHVRAFVRDQCTALGKSLQLCVVPISDPCGPAATQPDLDVLVVTDETVRGADLIAEERRKNALRPLQLYTVRLVQGDNSTADASVKASSTDIREWLARNNIKPGDEYEAAVRDSSTTTPTQPSLSLSERAPSAHVPPLGLSNRATESDEQAPIFFTPPNPEQLQSQTLWPEIEKLYGHGYELLSVATDRTSHLIASTCKATTPTHAVVRLFDAQQRFQPWADALQGHTLSITRVAFSPCGLYLLTVSRDRSWRLFRRAGQHYEPWVGERAHARVVWDGAWAPQVPERTEPPMFATASRDKSVKLWRLMPNEQDKQRPHSLIATLHVPDAAVSVAWASAHALAIGLENGDVLLYVCVGEQRDTWQLQMRLARHHTGAVHRMACRPPGAWIHAHNRVPYQLLSVGEDGCTRLVSWDPW